MDILNELDCPICMELPDAEVYQCSNGHVMCNKCYFKLTECPQCRHTLDRKRPTRNRYFEGLLDRIELDCCFNPEGCQVNLPRSVLKVHEVSCCYDFKKFGEFLNLCGRLDLKNCDFGVNSGNGKKAVEHFIEHGCRLSKSPKIEMDLCNFKRKSYFSIWPPVFVDFAEKTSYLLIGAAFNKESLALFAIILPYSGLSKVALEVNIQTTGNLPVLSYILEPVTLQKVKNDLEFPMNVSPWQTKSELIPYLNPKGNLVLNCEVKPKSKRVKAMKKPEPVISQSPALEIPRQRQTSSKALAKSKKGPTPTKRKRVTTSRATPETARTCTFYMKRAFLFACLTWLTYAIYFICNMKQSFEDLEITRENSLEEIQRIVKSNWLEDDVYMAPWLRNNLKGILTFSLAKYGSFEALNFLVQNGGVDLNIGNELGETPIFHAIADNDKEIGVQKLRTLLLNGAEATFETNKGRTLLHYVASNGSAKAAEFLLKHVRDKVNIMKPGLDVEERDRLGDTPLHCVMEHYDEYEALQIVKVLVQNGGDCLAINRNGHNLGDMAIRKKHEEWVNELFKIYQELNQIRCMPIK